MRDGNRSHRSPYWANRSPKRRVGEWLKQPGDPVKVDEPIASLETDKVSVEVPSPVAGVSWASMR